MFKSFQSQRKAAKIRLNWGKRGTTVPPFAILSVTNSCNLSCKGCYARQHHPLKLAQEEMKTEQLRNIFKEAQGLGIAIILIAGGEPLIRQDILMLTAEFPGIIFPLFTNGLLLTEEKLKIICQQPNVIPIISVEGEELETDERRGLGVFANITRGIQTMGEKRLFFGISLTVTRNNFQTVTSDRYIQQFIDRGCKIFFFVEYIPVQEGTEDQKLTEVQRKNIVELMASFRLKYPGLFIAFPGDEEKFGGCLAAGRGFIHINAQGGIEPCPFAPFSDSSLKNMSLQEALHSQFLKIIRENPEQIKEAKGGCALWENKDWVSSLINEESNKNV